jgi:hypothetical protein
MDQSSQSRRFLKRGIAIGVVLALGGVGLYCDSCRDLVGSCLIYGPGSADYGYPLVGGLSLVRSSARGRAVCWFDEDCAKYERERSEYGEDQGCVLIDNDVTHLGWDNRFIVCHQANSPQAHERRSGWWIVDTRKRRRYGPMSRSRFESEITSLGISEIEIRRSEGWRQ